MPVKETWLILSYCANADGRAASLHIDNRLHFMKKLKIQPLILSGPNFPKFHEFIHARVSSISPSGIWFEFRTFINRFVRNKFFGNLIKFPILLIISPFYLIEKVFVDIESQWSWFVLAALRGQVFIKRYQPAKIYSTGGSISAHLAAYLLSRKNRLPWIAELQDPLVHAGWNRSIRALRTYSKLERIICANAGNVVFLTNKARERAMERTTLGDKGRVIYPGARPDTFPDVGYHRSPLCRFVHMGSLSKTRNLKVFLAAMGELLTENPEIVPIFRLELYGSCDRVSRQLIEEFPYKDSIMDFGRVAHRKSLAVMKQADVLLLIQDSEEFSSETIPSKAYEYLLAGRPILGLIHENLELCWMLHDLGHQAVEATSVENVKNAVSLMVQQWRVDEFLLKPSPFTVSAAVNKLVKIAEEAKERQQFAKEDAFAE